LAGVDLLAAGDFEFPPAQATLSHAQWVTRRLSTDRQGNEHKPAGTKDGGQFTSQGGSKKPHPIRQLYDRAGTDLSIPYAQVEKTLAERDDRGKAELVPLAEEMELKGMKNKPSAHIRQAIKQKVLDRRSAAQRDQMIEDRGVQADAANAQHHLSLA